MQTVDLRRVFEKTGADPHEVAAELFPTHQRPRVALRRVMDGKTQLSVDLLSKLATILGVRVADLFTGASWKGRIRGRVHTLTNGEYRAELDTETWTTRVWHKTDLFHEEVLHSGFVPLSKYLNMLDELILNHNNKEEIHD